MNPQTKDKLYWRIGWLVMALVVGSFLWGYCGCVTPKTTVRDSPITTSGPAGPQSKSPSPSAVQQGGFNLSNQYIRYGSGGLGIALIGFMYWRNTLAMKTITLAALRAPMKAVKFLRK